MYTVYPHNKFKYLEIFQAQNKSHDWYPYLLLLSVNKRDDFAPRKL